jgi:fluoride exporter
MFPLNCARLNEPVLRRLDVVVAVLLGGFAGGAARYATVRAWPTGSSGFPWSTLTVNLAGAAVLGALVVLAGTVWRSRYARPLVGTGFCGAFTTFSAVVVDVDRLLGRGEAGVALGYLAASFLGGLVAAFVGVVTARAVVQWRPAAIAEKEI